MLVNIKCFRKVLYKMKRNDLIDCHVEKYYHVLELIKLMLVFYIRIYIGCGIPCDMQLLHVCLPKE